MVYHHAQHSRKSSTHMSHFAYSGLAPCGSTPPFPCDSIAPCSNDFARFDSCNFFDFFDFPTFLPTTDLTLPFAHLISIGQRSSPAMPYLIHRSHCTQVPMWLLPLISLSPNPDFRRRNLGAPQLRNFAIPPAATTNATDVTMD